MAACEVEADCCASGEVPKYASVTERYYTKRYKVSGKVATEHHCILCHSNKLCLVTLAPSHPVLAEGKVVKKVDFQISDDVDRLDNKAVGKSKKGAQSLTENSPICKLVCSDDTTYTVYACVKGLLLEVNEHLSENPGLVTSHPDAEGYIAIVQPRLNQGAEKQSVLIDQSEYEKALLRKQQDSQAGSNGSKE